MSLIAEDLLLLLLDDESGKVRGWDGVETALGGAVLAELAILGAVTIGERPSRWRPPLVSASGPAPEDRVLADAWAAVAEKPRAPQDLVERLGKGLVATLGDRLAERGVLERHESRLWGLLPRTRWPEADSSHEREVRRRLDDVLVQYAEPDDRTGALVALLVAIDRVHKIVPGMSAREVRKRAKEVAAGDWAARGVRDAVVEAHAAVAAVVAATAGATVFSSGT
jgi:hypothetical protein